MILDSLFLQNFRSHKEKQFKFFPKTTLIIGNNAIGKTNILEAITLLALGKSFRAGKEVEMISNGAELGRVEGILFASSQQPDSKIKLEVLLTQGELQGKTVNKKRLLVNGVKRRLIDFAGKLRVVLFQPEDLQLVIGSPSRRRDYLDFVLSQTSWEYYRCLLAYQKGLRRRNKLLRQIREGKAKRSQLEFWDRLLIKNGQIIHQQRADFIKDANRYFFQFPSGSFFNLYLEYDASLISVARLTKYSEVEIAAGATLVGPHRDDFRFFFQADEKRQKRDLAIYGSRGEQRMAILTLKMAELAFVKEKTKSEPLLLLDDIFSELDQEHRGSILKMMNKQQTVITTTDKGLGGKKLAKNIGVIKI